jgi:hypothetical protein
MARFVPVTYELPRRAGFVDARHTAGHDDERAPESSESIEPPARFAREFVQTRGICPPDIGDRRPDRRKPRCAGFGGWSTCGATARVVARTRAIISVQRSSKTARSRSKRWLQPDSAGTPAAISRPVGRRWSGARRDAIALSGGLPMLFGRVLPMIDRPGIATG